MARKLKSDKVLFLATLLLVLASLVMVYSASAVMAMERFGQPYLFLIKQGMWTAIGLPILALMMRIDYRTWREPMVISTGLVIVGLALVAVLFMAPINGTRRWFGVGGVGIQPSEVAKLVAVLFTAAQLERRLDRIDDLRYALLPIALVVGLLVGLIVLEPDFGTAAILAAVVGMMVVAAGLRWRYLVYLSLAALPVGAAVLISAPYRVRRLTAFLDPWQDPQGSGYQIIQSMYAVGTGGVTGRGLMAGVQKLFYLPEPHTDFIFAVVAEELGLIGASLVVMAFAAITWRGLRIAGRAPDRFGAFLALGLTGMVAIQAFVNLSVVLGLMPTKGIPLPFFSAGGSSLLINMVGMGILLNVSQHASAVHEA